MGSAAKPKRVRSKRSSGSEAQSSTASVAREFGDELRGLGGEEFVFVEERVDHVRRDEDTEQEERQRDDPEMEPPAARALSNDGVENPGEQAADDNGEELDLGPISGPGRPGLDGDFVKF